MKTAFTIDGIYAKKDIFNFLKLLLVSRYTSVVYFHPLYLLILHYEYKVFYYCE